MFDDDLRPTENPGPGALIGVSGEPLSGPALVGTRETLLVDSLRAWLVCGTPCASPLTMLRIRRRILLPSSRSRFWSHLLPLLVHSMARRGYTCWCIIPKFPRPPWLLPSSRNLDP